ncbi:hypothetical protein U0070_019995, partial [Myodes glareolus]
MDRGNSFSEVVDKRAMSELAKFEFPTSQKALHQTESSALRGAEKTNSQGLKEEILKSRLGLFKESTAMGRCARSGASYRAMDPRSVTVTCTGQLAASLCLQHFCFRAEITGGCRGNTFSDKEACHRVGIDCHLNIHQEMAELEKAERQMGRFFCSDEKNQDVIARTVSGSKSPSNLLRKSPPLLMKRTLRHG